jgi:hypothetical protein
MYSHIIAPPLGGQYFGNAIFDFFGVGDPNQLGTDSANGNLQFAGVGSTYRRLDGSSTTTFFYVKTSPTSAANPTGVWTGK